MHLRARDYDPVTGQFISVDPAVDTTKQPYAYTGNNPIQRTDPSGLDFMQDVIANVAAWVPAVLCASDQVVAFMAGAADALTFGLSSVVLSAAVPGYDEFVAGHEAAFTAGSIVATVVQAAVTIVATAGAGAGLAVGLVAVKVAAKAAIKSAVKTAQKTAARSSTRMAEATVVGAGRDKAMDAMIKFSKRNPEAGLHDIVGHGSPNSIAGRSATEVAERVGAVSNGQNIRLLSCQTGCPSGSFAQDLANLLTVRVKAPTTDIGASGRGNTLTIFDGGEWRWFDPQL